MLFHIKKHRKTNTYYISYVSECKIMVEKVIQTTTMQRKTTISTTNNRNKYRYRLWASG